MSLALSLSLDLSCKMEWSSIKYSSNLNGVDLQAFYHFLLLWSEVIVLSASKNNLLPFFFSNFGVIYWIDVLKKAVCVNLYSKTLWFAAICIVFHIVSDNSQAQFSYLRFIFCIEQHNAERLLKLIDEVYRWLPLGTIVNNRVLVVHGGISDSTDLDLIRSLDRGKVSYRIFVL